jgi:6-phosphogluconolactonase
LSPPTVSTPNAISVAIDPTGRWAYVANGPSSTVSQYRIDATGALTPLSPPTVSTGNIASSVTVDPSGRTVYVANQGSDTISQYNIGVTGTLTPLSPPTASTGPSPTSITTTGTIE